jgi:hypothetical protein
MLPNFKIEPPEEFLDNYGQDFNFYGKGQTGVNETSIYCAMKFPNNPYIVQIKAPP